MNTIVRGVPQASKASIRQVVTASLKELYLSRKGDGLDTVISPQLGPQATYSFAISSSLVVLIVLGSDSDTLSTVPGRDYPWPKAFHSFLFYWFTSWRLLASSFPPFLDEMRTIVLSALLGSHQLVAAQNGSISGPTTSATTVGKLLVRSRQVPVPHVQLREHESPRWSQSCELSFLRVPFTV